MVTRRSNAPVAMYTDGACYGNPGPGGWAVLLKYREHEKELFGHEDETTNNRMELTAVIKGLEVLKWPCTVEIYTDSQYVQKGMTQWIKKWERDEFLNGDGVLRKNADLWKRLLSLSRDHKIKWKWIRGHSGNELNERVDALAKRAAKRTIKGL